MQNIARLAASLAAILQDMMHDCTSSTIQPHHRPKSRRDGTLPHLPTLWTLHRELLNDLQLAMMLQRYASTCLGKRKKVDRKMGGAGDARTINLGWSVARMRSKLRGMKKADGIQRELLAKLMPKPSRPKKLTRSLRDCERWKLSKTEKRNGAADRGQPRLSQV
jgi:hypothetical protein